MLNERREYADRRKRGSSVRLVKLPATTGEFRNSGEAPEAIARRLRLAAITRKAADGGK